MTEQYSDKIKLYTLEKNILSIQLILQTDNHFYRLIKSRKSNFNELYSGICEDLKKADIKIDANENGVLKYSHTIMIPSFYSDELIRKELVTNIKNHSSTELNSEVKIDLIELSSSSFALTIKNIKSDKEYNKSNLEGIKCLNLLSASDLFQFDYHHELVGENFIQKLTFKLNKDGHE